MHNTKHNIAENNKSTDDEYNTLNSDLLSAQLAWVTLLDELIL